MDKLYGLKGELSPKYAFEDIDEIVFDSPTITIRQSKGEVEAVYTSEHEEAAARSLIDDYLAAWSFAHDTKASAQLGHTWKPTKNGGKAYQVSISGTVRIIGGITHTQTLRFGYVVASPPPFSFKYAEPLRQKMARDEALRDALKYYKEEIVDDVRPLYGVYKALETLCQKLGRGTKGQTALASLANQPYKYINEVMESTQQTRHALGSTKARVTISESECRERAKVLIQAYANSIS